MSNEQPHDPTVTLRLELGRVTDQRNAFQAALHKDVLAIIRKATHTADIVGCLQVELDDLRADNARLKAEVDRLTDAITAGAITPDAREVQS
jgi:cell division protein FtsB